MLRWWLRWFGGRVCWLIEQYRGSRCQKEPLPVPSCGWDSFHWFSADHAQGQQAQDEPAGSGILESCKWLDAMKTEFQELNSIHSVPSQDTGPGSSEGGWPQGMCKGPAWTLVPGWQRPAKRRLFLNLLPVVKLCSSESSWHTYAASVVLTHQL